MQHQHRVLAVWAKYKCNPMKSLAGMFVQAPIFIGFFSALRGFAAHKASRWLWPQGCQL
jgi:membrane protein insertase Oxa1/YidC/SpoIIIJ